MGMMRIPMVVHEPDFMIHGVLKYEAFGQELWITDTTVGAWIITAVLLLIGVIARKKIKAAGSGDIPGAFQNALEMGMEALENMAQGILGANARRFVNYIGTIFLFILFCNLSGLFGLRAPTADFGVTFLLGMFTFFIVNYQGLKNRGVGHFTSLFQPIPVLFPINVIGEIANPISISLRLFANLLSGVIIMGLWYGMMPWFAKIGIPAALHVYCDLFSGCIQTYVFCMLTMVYINDKME
ncbi:MAG: F0F1 ATP synthase subunit A [Hungatella sp.]|nr:F0F1 ATP synthase subunit A [Hungatella sp.]